MNASIIIHKGEKRIRLDFSYDVEQIKIIRELKGKWEPHTSMLASAIY
jgi:hypothetical protein